MSASLAAITGDFASGLFMGGLVLLAIYNALYTRAARSLAPLFLAAHITCITIVFILSLSNTTLSTPGTEPSAALAIMNAALVFAGISFLLFAVTHLKLERVIKPFRGELNSLLGALALVGALGTLLPTALMQALLLVIVAATLVAGAWILGKTLSSPTWFYHPYFPITLFMWVAMCAHMWMGLSNAITGGIILCCLMLLTLSCTVEARRLRNINQKTTQVMDHIISDTQEKVQDTIEQAQQNLRASASHLHTTVEQKDQLLNQTLEQLKLSNQLKDEFLAKVSHEFLTPLNGIMGSLDLVSDTTLSHEQMEFIGSASNSAKHLHSLISDILDLSYFASGELKLKREDFCLEHSLQHLLQKVEPRASKKGLKLKLNIAPEVPKLLHGDSNRLCQAVDKFVGNAIKFSESGDIEVGVQCLEHEGDSVQLRFSIRDQGIGIPESLQDSLFESFTQLETFISRQYSGAGIGLAISYHIIKQMNGRISVRSAEGQGSEFSFTAHLRKARRKPADSPQKLTLVKSNEHLEGKVLIVEDNPVNQMVLKGILKKLGVNADIANNGKDALAMLATQSYDLVLMDCQMPIMNGFQATAAIRERTDSKRDIPIIAVTANAMPSDHEACLKAGMNDYLAKPIRSSALYFKLQKWLDQG